MEKDYMHLINNKKELERNLENNFIKALKDENFVKVVNSLDIKDEIKYKYTTSLQEIAKNVAICAKCKGLSFCPYDVKGVTKHAKVEDDFIRFYYKDCPFKEKYDKNLSYIKNVYSYKMPKEIMSASFKNIYKDDSNRLEAIKYLKNFYDNYNKGTYTKGLYLHGNFGCGKTYLISALFNELAKKNVKSVIVHFPELLVNLKNTFNNPEDNYEEKLNTVLEAPLLLLDDIGAEKITDWSRDEVLCVILQYRMDEKLPTFFTSNLTIKELENHLIISGMADDKIKAKRIIERIKYLTQDMEMISVNRRK